MPAGGVPKGLVYPLPPSLVCVVRVQQDVMNCVCAIPRRWTKAAQGGMNGLFGYSPVCRTSCQLSTPGMRHTELQLLI